MKKKTLTTIEDREVKFLLRMPLFAIPILTIFFWSMGGGKARATGNTSIAKGFNMLLPAAHVPSIVRMDKMDYYEKARRDSIAEGQRARMEASYAKALGIDSTHGPDALAQAVRTRLDRIKQTLAVQTAQTRQTAETTVPRPSPPAPSFHRPNADLSRLEKVMTALQHDDGSNSELTSLTAVLEKLTTLQSPHRDTAQRHPAVSRPAFTIKAVPEPDDTLRFDSSVIEAMVPEEQVLVNGSELQLQLTQDILLDGRRIPAATPIYGIVSLSGERLKVTVNTIIWQGRIFPVQLQVDDEDGLPGIYIPGAPLTDAARESASSEIGAVGPTVVSSGLAGQAANVGMSLTRSLIGKKIRPVRVTVPAGYHVLLHHKTDLL